MVGCGIIPARAGFTGGSECQTTGTWDHPRSRGVYAYQYAHALVTFGSSPLARGLPAAHPIVESFVGIIPARAGFTLGYAPVCRFAPDHPRSRGVYSLSPFVGALSPGSSPLARGLLEILQ